MRHRYLLWTLLTAVACNGEITGLELPSNPATETFAPALGVTISQMSKTEEGVYYKDIIVGTGPDITVTSDTVILSYAGYLKNGTLFETGSNVFLGPNLEGFRKGIVGMKEGGKRKLVVPSELGYGSTVIRNSDLSVRIPRQSTLVYDVTVLRVHTPAAQAQD
jgi:FKBP-type peptidyl-prolyl cis-trans isomerase FkpA